MLVVALWMLFLVVLFLKFILIHLADAIRIFIIIVNYSC